MPGPMARTTARGASGGARRRGGRRRRGARARGGGSAMPGPMARTTARAQSARARAEAWRGAAVRARRKALVLGSLLVGVLVVYSHRHQIAPGFERYIRYATVIALLVLGWAF